MDKKVLIGVDGSNHALRAVDYVGLMAREMPKLSATIYHVVRSVPPPVLHGDQHDAQNFRLAQRMQQLTQVRSSAITQTAHERLKAAGFAAGRINAKSQIRGLGIARDLVFEATQGLYEAIVLGRRGLSKMQELFLGSVTNKVIQHAGQVAVWVVGGKVNNHRILCAVDNSQGSLRAVKHLACMLEGGSDYEISLFHAGPDLESLPPVGEAPEKDEEMAREFDRFDREASDSFNAQALQVFKEHGMDSNRVRTINRQKNGSIANAILKEAAQSDCGSVVMGRRGEGGAFWLGHVCDKVLAKADDLAVWVVG